jgi:hypothetical protein
LSVASMLVVTDEIRFFKISKTPQHTSAPSLAYYGSVIIFEIDSSTQS